MFPRFFRSARPREERVPDMEAVFRDTSDAVKYLDKTEFKRFMAALELSWEAWDKILTVQTREEKEIEKVKPATVNTDGINYIERSANEPN